MNTCLARRCQREVGLGVVMCPEHWARVPFEVKARVDATWREFMDKGCIQCYLNALSAARDAAETPR